jgi:hypothetical protein
VSVSDSEIYQYLLHVQGCLAARSVMPRCTHAKSIPCSRSATETTSTLSQLRIVWLLGFDGYWLEGFAAAAERWMAFHGGIVSMKGC